ERQERRLKEEMCADYDLHGSTEFRVRRSNIRIENDQIKFIVTPDTTNEVSNIEDDSITNTAYMAALLEIDPDDMTIINDREYHYRYTDAQNTRIEQMKLEDPLFFKRESANSGSS